jgi:hypothetical protein
LQKPLDILEPTIVDAARFPNELALMLLGSSCSGDSVSELMLYNPYPGSLHDVPQTAPDDGGVQTIVPPRSLILDETGPNAVPIITHETPETTIGILSHCRWESSDSRHYFKLDKGQSLPSGLGIKHDSSSRKLSQKDLNRWTRAIISMRQQREKYLPNKELKPPNDCIRVRSTNLGVTAFNVQNLREGFIDDFVDDPLFWIMLFALPTVYGFVHRAANFEFPTKAEKIMWRVACILVIGGIPVSFVVLVILGITLTVLQYLWKWAPLPGKWANILSVLFEIPLRDPAPLNSPIWNPTPRKFCHRLLRLVGWITLYSIYFGVIGSILCSAFFFVVLLPALYFSARIFIIIEAFISVRRLPLGVFITVAWADYIPHL